MDKDVFRRLERILEAVWEAPEADREPMLKQLCGDDDALRLEVEHLLALDGEDSFLESPPWSSLDDSTSQPTATLPPLHRPQTHAAGTRIGSYEIVRPLGAGGMGSVYLARRHDGVHHQQIALKVLSAALGDAGLRERFSAERDILAHLSHPNIAALLDGGTTDDGLPYLVMEWVDGVPIDRYCREHRLPLRRRLELFLKVCAAVQEAHRSLIVHRDLKPANILVDRRGEPKLLDFGIAKLLSPETLARTLLVTAPGNMPMTPAYASPEQVAGGTVTTAVDVYALGIVLHELLTGLRPYDLSGIHLAEAIRRICVEVPPKPSERIATLAKGPDDDPEDRSPAELRALERQLEGDLDAIVAMALRKEPERRYPSAERLRDDVKSYLDGHPVKAADDTWTYRTLKFVRRRRGAVAATAGALLLSLGFSTALWKQDGQVREERRRAEVTSEFLLDLFVGIDPWSVEARDPSAAEMLERGQRALQSRELEAGDRADLQHTIGVAYSGIGRLDEAEKMLRKALQSRRHLLGKDRLQTAETMVELANVMRWQGQIPQGLELIRSAREIYQKLDATHTREAVIAEIKRADYLDLLGHYDEAESTLLATRALCDEQGFHDLKAVAGLEIGVSKRLLLKHTEALEMLTVSLEEHRATYGEDHPQTATVLMEIGTTEQALGRFDNAERAFQEAGKILVESLGDDHPATLTLMAREAHHALDSSDFQRAEILLDRAERAIRDKLGPNITLAGLQRVRSLLLFQTNRNAEAEQAAQEALDIYRRQVGERHVLTAETQFGLAKAIAAEGGRQDKARELMSRSLATLEDLTGRDSSRTLVAISAAGWIEYLGRNYEESERLLRVAIEGMRRLEDPGRPDLASTYNNLAMVQHWQRKYEEAEKNYRKAVEIAQQAYGDPSLMYAGFVTNLSRILEHTDRIEEAEQTLAEADLILDRAGVRERHILRLHSDRMRTKFWQREGRYREIDDLLQPWLAHLDTVPRISSFERRVTFEMAASNLEAMDRPDEAAELRRRIKSPPETPP